jgi:hypothetical protein
MSDRAGPMPERRKHTRIKTRLLGRYMLADRREARCTIDNVSLGGIAVHAPERGLVGETVIVYIDHIGRVEGQIVRVLDAGFAVTLAGSARATTRFASRLEELQSGRAADTGHERRTEPRIALGDDLPGRSVLEGTECEVLNLSVTGADVRLTSGRMPPVGATVHIGRLRGRVVRRTQAGIAIEFVDVPDTMSLTERLNEIALSRSMAT